MWVVGGKLFQIARFKTSWHENSLRICSQPCHGREVAVASGKHIFAAFCLCMVPASIALEGVTCCADVLVGAIEPQQFEDNYLLLPGNLHITPR